MIAIQHLSKQIGSRILFDDVNLQLNPKSTYGIVGANGAGKSTFLKLVTKEEEPTLGDVVISKNATLGWLKQDQYLFENETILNIVLMGKPLLWDVMQKKEHLLSQENWSEKQAHELDDLESIFQKENGYEAESIAHYLLVGLGLENEKHKMQLNTLSGGYKLRVLLARALYNLPDILLLDEPTNYLDITSINWLEKYLKNDFKGLSVVVSHDHDFLNNICTHILDIDYGDIREYPGNYENFLNKKKEVEEQKIHEKKHLEKKAEKLKTFVERFRSKPSKSRQAMSKQKQLEKIEWPDIEKSSRKIPKFYFKQKKAAGKIVLKIKDLSKSFQKLHLIKNFNAQINRNEKIVILGKNGTGKTTLIKMITNELQPDSGDIAWSETVSVGYFSQNLKELLFQDMNILDWMAVQTNQDNEKIRQTLGNVLFTQDDVYKKVPTLSGGEMTRLLIASIMLQNNNVLILDEPTNHLDLEARDALAKSLKVFDGTVIVVSHDRHFFTKFASRYLAFTKAKIIESTSFNEISDAIFN
jgi:ATPase subunit of ABC transporter with duplicated ATPase domains